MNQADPLSVTNDTYDPLISPSPDDDVDLGVASFVLDSVAAELGFFFLLSMVAVGLLLDQVNGKIFRIKIFLMNRDFQLVQNEFFIKFVNFLLRLLCWVFLIMPFISLCVWGSGLLVKSANLGESNQVGICVLLAGLALDCYQYGFLTIRWNNYKFSRETMYYLLVAQLSFSGYQFIATLYDTSFDNFFGYSCVFLAFNAVVMILMIYLNSGISGVSMRDFIENLPQGEERDPKRETVFDKELKQERLDEDKVITKEEVADIFTIGSLKEPNMKAAFGAGVSKVFNKMHHFRKKTLNLSVWAFAAGVLVAYAFAVYYNMKSWLGFLTMTAVLTTDVILFCIYKSKVIKSATMLSFTVILNRLFLIVFGGYYWIYGYMILYIYYGAMLVVVIGKKRFPFEGAYADINLDNIQKRSHNIDVSRIPEFLLGLVTVIYIVMFIALVAINPDPNNIPLRDLTIGKTTFKFYMVGIFSILIVMLLFCIYCTYRLFVRKRKRINPTRFYFIQDKSFDLYWIFITATFLMAIVISLLAFWATQEPSFLSVGILGSLSIILYLNAILYYSMNDYKIFQDIKSINQKINRHNTRINDLKSKVTNLKKDIQDGKIDQIGGAENVGLAQKLIASHKEEKKAQKTLRVQRKLEAQNQTDSSSKSLFRWTKTNKDTTAVAPVLVLTDQQQAQFEKSRTANQTPTPNGISSKIVPKSPADMGMTTKETTAKVDLVPKSGVSSNTRRDLEIEQIINDELSKDQKHDSLDDMYEGGEPSLNATSNELGQTEYLKNLIDGDDSDTDSEKDFDPDNEAEHDSNNHSRQFKALGDWRDSMSSFSAYFSRNLRKNDYQIINSLTLSFISLVLMAFFVCLRENTLVGITIAIPFLHYGMAFFSFLRSLSTDSNMTFTEYAMFFASYAVQYGWGVFNLFWLYNLVDMDPSDPGNAPAGQFIVLYLIVLPFITSVTSAIAKWIDDKGRFTTMFLVQLIITFIQGVGMLVCAYLFLTFVPGIIITVIIVVLGYIVLQSWIYIKNDYYLPKLWAIINLILVVCIIVSSFIVGLILPEFANFLGFSISIWLLAFFILLYSFAEIFSDIQNIEKKPVFISPWIFPVYIYNPKKNDVEPHNGPAAALIVGFCLLILWAILATAWMKPTSLGVGLSIIFELTLIIVILYLVQQTQIQMHDVQPYIDNLLIRQAWNDAKMGYVNGRGAPNREQLLTYSKQKMRRDHFRNFIRKREGRTKLNAEELYEQVVIIEDKDIDIEWIDESMVDLSSNNSMYSYLFKIEQDLNKIYIEELELIIQFQLLLIQQAVNLQEQERKYLFTFLTEKKTALFALGIVITIPEEGTLNVRYARVITQIQKLSPEKQTMFNTLRENFIIEQRKAEILIKERAKIEEEKQKERMKAMAEMSDAKRKLLDSVNENMEVDDMPDCMIKYNKILKECQTGKIFTDKQFAADDKSLGPGCLNRGVSQWIRARDVPDMVLYKDQINHADVVQGALGDCYFLSAISVLGEKYVKDIITTVDDQEEWRKCGAFCVKFYKNGYEEIIIVDDYFPAYGNGDWAFVKGGNDGKELWPMVLEKAYAKMYGSYNYIEAGKVQYALADMTDGFPEQIDLKTDGKNIQVFWEKIKTLKRYGCLMGAGSPEHPQGDAHINEMGIVQGHAYAVIDVQEVDNCRLIQLRNPHGATGAEWKGDWADDDMDKWTERMRQKLGFEEKNDGVFWMDVLDFIEQYSFLYICRILDESDGWKEYRIQGAWQGPTAEGLPSRSYPNARIDFNPQYEITVTRPCDGFVSLMQMDHVNMFKGKHQQFFMISKVNGQRIKKVDKLTTICRSGAPINLNIITSECDFDKSVSYPYKFTLMVANMEHGDEGEGEFQVLFYATDPNIKITELPYPDDMPSGGAPIPSIED